MSVPNRLANGAGNWPDADKYMQNWDFVEAIAKGNYLSNPGLETWGATTSFSSPASGTLVAPGWVCDKAGTSAPTFTVSQEGTTKDSGSYAGRVFISGAGSADSEIKLKQSIASPVRFGGETMLFGMKVRLATGTKVRLSITDGSTTNYSDYHTGDGTFQKLYVSIAMQSVPTELTVRLEIDPADFSDTVYFDSGYLYRIPSQSDATTKAALAFIPIDDVPAAATTLAKNLLKNANFTLWQRGTSFATIADGTYTADRFVYLKSGAMVHTVSRDTDVPTVSQSGVLSNYSLKLDCTTADASIAAGDYCRVSQRIEGYDWARVAQQDFVLTFWVKASKTGTYCVAFRNSGADRSFVAEYTISVANTWEKKTINVSASPSAGTWDYTNGVGLEVAWTLAGGSTYQTTAGAWQTGNYFATSNQVNGTDDVANNFWLAQVQLELGSTASAFEIKTIDKEVEECQRYYEKSYVLETAPGTATFVNSYGFRAAQADFTISIQFQTRKAKAPTVTLYNPNSGSSGTWRDGTASADKGAVVEGAAGAGTMSFCMENGASTTAGNKIYGHWTASAEL